MNYIINISSDALMEMCLATLEAYVVRPRGQSPKQNRAGMQLGLETYGLLWGHEVALPDGDRLISVEKLTVDSMAERRNDSVAPSSGRKVIKDMVTSYWPKYSLLGDFHTHPYGHYTEVEKIKGYEFTEGDCESMVELRKKDKDFRMGLVMTVASLERSSYKSPEHLGFNTVCWTFKNYRFWLTACAIHVNANGAQGVENEPMILPESSEWANEYESDEVESVYLHVPYLSEPWEATTFGKLARNGRHVAGVI